MIHRDMPGPEISGHPREALPQTKKLINHLGTQRHELDMLFVDVPQSALTRLRIFLP